MEMLTPLLGVLALEVIGSLVFLLVWRKRRRSGKAARGKAVGFQLQPKLLSPAGRTFYGLLTSAVGSEYSILIRVRADDVLVATRTLNLQRYLQDCATLPRRHLDFLLCDRSTLAVRCAIVLSEQADKDEFLARACRAAELPLVRFVVGKDHAVQTVRNRILKAVGRSNEMFINGVGVSRTVTRPAATPQPEAAPPENPPPVMAQAASPTEADTAAAQPRCPKCTSAMQRRKVKSGAQAGRTVLVCVRYPQCKGIRALE